MDLTKYTLKELKEIKTKIEDKIRNFDDGYFYVCNIQSYGNNYDTYLKNYINAEELFLNFNGDNGYCNLYTNSPLITLTDSDSIYYIENYELYKRWKVYKKLVNINKFTNKVKNEMGQVIKPVLYGNVKTNLIREQKINRILKN